MELGLGEAVEDLLDHRSVGGATAGGEVELGPELIDVGGAVVVGGLVVAVGAVDVGERLPAL